MSADCWVREWKLPDNIPPCICLTPVKLCGSPCSLNTCFTALVELESRMSYALTAASAFSAVMPEKLFEPRCTYCLGLPADAFLNWP